MPCSSTSTLTPISSVPVMPPLAGVPSSVSQALKLWAQQVLAQIQAAGGATGVNAVPQQYALLAGSALPPIASVSNCTVALDATKQLFGAGSYKVSLTGSPAVLTLAADTAWPLQPGWQWMVSFFQQATAAVAGEVTVTTSAGTAYSATFTTTLDSAGWDRLYDALNLVGDTSAAFGLSFTFTGGAGQTVWLDGLMLSPFYGRPSVLPSFQNGSAPLLLDNNPDGFYSKILSSRTAGNVAFNFRGAWSSAASYLTGDEVVYGPTYWVALAGSTNVQPATGVSAWQAVGSYSEFVGAWSSTATYAVGAEVTYSGSYWIAVAQNSNSAPSTTNANWQIAGSTSASAIVYTDGATVQSLQPAEASADVTATHTANDTSNVSGVPAATVSQGASRANAAIDSTNVVVASGLDFSRSYTNKGALATANNADGVPPGTTYTIPQNDTSWENMLQNGGITNGVEHWWSSVGAGVVSVADPWGVTHDVVYASGVGEYQQLANPDTDANGANEISVVPGDTYVYDFWIKTGGAGSWVLYDTNKPGGSQIYTIGAPTAWTHVTQQWTVPSSGVIRSMGLIIANPSTTLDSVYVCAASIRKVRSLDSEVADGTEFARFPYAHFDDLTHRRIATINGAVSPLGSIVTGSSTVTLSYTSTSSSITISWTAGTINRMDGSQTTVSSGSVTVTGLSASTTYYAAAYWDEVAQTVNFVTGQSGAVGSPAILYASEAAAVAWQAQLQARLNLGWVPVVTAASGGTGGGNGSSGCCLRGPQLIELASGVMREAQELTTGDVLSSPDGPIRITQLRFEPWAEWYRVEFNDGRILEVAPDHRFMDPSGVQIHARDLKLQTIVEARNCYLSVARLELCTDRDIKVGIEVEEPHVYYVDGVLSHNKVYC